MTNFDRYWFRNYDRISYTMDGNLGGVKTPKIIGIPMPFISIIIFIFSLGLIIFPSMWRYKTKIIRHRFLGTKHKYENPSSQTEEITMYRFSKVLFSGFMFYLVFSFFLKIIAQDMKISYYYWFIFIIFYVAFFSLIPIMGTEGFEFWHKGRFGWLCSITVLFLGFLSLLVFNNMLLVLIGTIISIMIASIFILWKELM